VQNTNKKIALTVLILGVLTLIGVKVFTSFQHSPPIPNTPEPHVSQQHYKVQQVPEVTPKPQVVVQPTPLPDDNIPTPEPSEAPAEEAPHKPKTFVLCEHIVSGETQYEFTGQIRLINKGSQTVSGWSVNWEYEDDSTILEATDVALAGNNPYTGEYLSWNADIEPGKTVTFSFTGLKGGDTAPLRVRVSGSICI